MSERDKLKHLSPLGHVLRFLGVVRVHEDGDICTAIFRWWHPVTWVMFVALIVPCAFMGEKITDAFPIRVSRYFRENPERLKWL